MMRSSAIDAMLFFWSVMVDSAEVPCASVRCPARTAVRTRRSDSSSRQPSIATRSRSSSLLIDWPLTLPTDAR